MEANSVEFRKVAYTVNSVSKVYFRALTECLRDLGDVDNLSNSAKAIKKVIIPTIPEEVIIKGELDEEFYVWHQSIEPEEINELILKVVGCFRLQQIKKAEEKGDKEELKQHQEGLELVEKYLQPTTESNAITVQATEINEQEKADFLAWKKEKEELHKMV